MEICYAATGNRASLAALGVSREDNVGEEREQEAEDWRCVQRRSGAQSRPWRTLEATLRVLRKIRSCKGV